MIWTPIGIGSSGTGAATTGNPNGVLPDASQNFTLTVSSASSTTTLTSSQDPATVGMSVTFIATVNGAAPTGTVAFTDGGNTISGCGAVSFSGGTANARTAFCIASSLGAGTHSIVASYSGDISNPGSISVALMQIIRLPLGKTDFNGDHNSDIIWDNGTSSQWLYYMFGGVVQVAGTLPGTAPGWVLAGIGDFNGDGHADLLWKNTADPTQYWIYLMNGTTIIGGGPVTVVAGYTPTQIGDFDGDGKADILWENASGGRWIFFMNGASVSSGQAVPGAAPGWVIVGVGDFNGDGRTDLLWNNTANPQQYWIYLMNGASVVGGGGLMVTPGYVATQIADFDGNGRADILWENGTASRWIYFMNGATVLSSVAAPGSAPGWTVAGTGDFNGDGRADLLWQNRTHRTSTGSICSTAPQ